MADYPKNLRIRPGVIGLDQLDPAVWEAVRQGANLWPGTVEVTSVGRHKGDRGNHSGGHAVDVRLYDESGRPLSNLRDGGRHARDYERFWQNGVAMASEAYPDLPNRARWGGNFLNSVGADYMHLDTTPGRGTAGGDLLHGATPGMLKRWGGQSEGIPGGDWTAHREFLRTGRRPASKPAPGLLAQAGEAALNFVMPAAQADTPVNPFDGIENAMPPDDVGASSANPFDGIENAMPPDEVGASSANPFDGIENAMPPDKPGDTASPTSIQGTGLQATVPTGPVNPAPLASAPNQPPALPPTPNERMRSTLSGVGPLGQAAAGMLPYDPVEVDKQAARVGQTRLPPTVLQDLRGGAPGFSPDDLAGVQEWLARGNFPDPLEARNEFAGRVERGPMEALDDAMAEGDAYRQMQADAGPRRTAMELLGRAVDEATLGMARPELPMTGNPGLDRLLGASNRAQQRMGQDIQEQNPIGTAAATVAGGVLPYALGLKGLRAVRAARGLPPVGPGATGAVVEGAQLGGPIEFLRKPEGQASPGDELQQRILQSGLGVALGAALDAGLFKAGELSSMLGSALRDKRTRAAVLKEAKAAGYADPREYLDTLFQTIQTPDGPIARPSRDVLNGRISAGEPATSTAVPAGDAATPLLSAPGHPVTKPLLPGLLPGPVKPVVEAAPTPKPEPKPVTPESLRAQADSLDAAAQAVTNPVAREVLQTEAALLRDRADRLAGGDKKRSREDFKRERDKERVTVNDQADDLITAIRKLGGIDVVTESDWADRLSQLNKRIVGLAGIERKNSKGRSLDDLAEALHERGYLKTRDKRELEARLSQAETGAPQWAYTKANYEGPEPPRVEPKQEAVVVVDGRASFKDVPEDTDWIIDTETGSVYASKPISEEDFIDIEIDRKRDAVRQQREAEWARRELDGNDGDAVPAAPERKTVPDAGGDGVPERVENPVQGRAGDQSGQDIAERSSITAEIDSLSAQKGQTRVATAGDLIDDMERRLEGVDWKIGMLSDLRAKQGAPKTPGQIMRDELEAERVDLLDQVSSLKANMEAFREKDRADSLKSMHKGMLSGMRDEIEARVKAGDLSNEDAANMVEKAGQSGNVYSAVSTFKNEIDGNSRSERARITNQVEPEQPGDFFGGLSDAEKQTADKLALEELDKEKQRQRNANNAPAADEGLFWLDNRQTDMGTLYSNPIGAVAKNLYEDVKEAPGRAALTVLAGGTLAGLNSKEEPGSVKWWRDVLTGGVLLHGGLAALRRAKLTGKGGHFERFVFDRVGGWVDSLPLIGRGPAEVRDLKREQQGMLQRMNRQTEQVGTFLLKQFTPSERAVMADLIEGRGIAPELGRVHQQAKELDDFLTDMGQKWKDLGMLPEDMELGAYIHRYYEEHLGLTDGLSNLFKKAKGQSISGSWSMARGRMDDFDREYLSPGARKVVEEFEALGAEIEWIEKDIKRWDKRYKQAMKSDDPDLFMEKYEEAMQDLNERMDEAKGRQKELQKADLREFIGAEQGKAKSFIFTADEAGRVDAGVGPVKIHAFKPEAGEQAMGSAVPVKELPELLPSDRRWTLRGTDGGKVKLHRDWTKAERKALGEIDDVGYRFTRGMAEAAHDYSLAVMFDKIYRRKDWVSDEFVEGWKLVPGGKVGAKSPLRKYGKLAGKYVRPDVWAGVGHYGRSVLGNSRPAQVYKNALMKWKLWHTADNPTTHFNNLHSNGQMLFLSGYGPKSLAKAIKVMHGGEKNAQWREMAEEGLFGSDFTSSTLNAEGSAAKNLMDLAEALRTQPEIPDAAMVTSLLMDVKSWWHESGQHLREAKGPKQKVQAVASLLQKPAALAGKTVSTPYNAYAKVMRKAYRFEDNLFKAAVYLAEREKGATRLKAAETAERYFFDYYDVPDAVRWMRDFPIGSPFISYTYLAAPAMLRNAIERPERMIALLAGYEAINYASQQVNEQGGKPGEYWGLSEAEDLLSAPWDKGRSLSGMRNTVHLPSAAGYRIALGNAHALGNPFQSESGDRKMAPEMPLLGKAWGSTILGGNPIMALADVAFNEDWKGKPIYGEYDSTDDKIKKGLTYLYRAWGPSTPVFPGSYHQSKILEGLAGDVADARKRGENHLAAPIVDTANSVAEALGMQQLTGKDRLGNPIDTTEAALGSVGIKLRPPGYDQTLDIELGRLQKERQAIRAEFRKKQVDLFESRYTNEQMKKFEETFKARMDDVDKREDRLFDARKTLKKAGVPLKKPKRKLQ